MPKTTKIVSSGPPYQKQRTGSSARRATKPHQEQIRAYRPPQRVRLKPEIKTTKTGKTELPKHQPKSQKKSRERQTHPWSVFDEGESAVYYPVSLFLYLLTTRWRGIIACGCGTAELVSRNTCFCGARQAVCEFFEASENGDEQN